MDLLGAAERIFAPPEMLGAAERFRGPPSSSGTADPSGKCRVEPAHVPEVRRAEALTEALRELRREAAEEIVAVARALLPGLLHLHDLAVHEQ